MDLADLLRTRKVEPDLTFDLNNEYEQAALNASTYDRAAVQHYVAAAFSEKPYAEALVNLGWAHLLGSGRGGKLYKKFGAFRGGSRGVTQLLRSCTVCHRGHDIQTLAPRRFCFLTNELRISRLAGLAFFIVKGEKPRGVVERPHRPSNHSRDRDYRAILSVRSNTSPSKRARVSHDASQPIIEYNSARGCKRQKASSRQTLPSPQFASRWNRSRRRRLERLPRRDRRAPRRFVASRSRRARRGAPMVRDNSCVVTWRPCGRARPVMRRR